MLSVDPPLVEHGGGVDVAVEYADAVLIRVRRPDGVYHDFPADPPSGTQVFHISPVYGGDISVTALNPSAATSGNPYGESAPRVVPVRTYTLPPLSDLGLPDLNLGIPAIQIEANEVHIGEPALTQLSELAQLRDGIAGLPAPFPAWLAEPPAIQVPPAFRPLPIPAVSFPPDILTQVLAQVLAMPPPPGPSEPPKKG
jgi:hypothetical protein